MNSQAMAIEAVASGTESPQPKNAAFARLHARLRAEKQAQAKSSTILVWIIRIAVAAVMIGGWQLIVAAGWVNEAIVSSPSAVWRYLVTTLPTAELWINLWSTLKATLAGLIAGSAVGIFCGILLFESDTLRRGLLPFITFLNSLPRPALAPIFILWFGLGIGSKVAVSVSIVIFVLLLNTMAGLQGANADHLFLSRSLGMSRLQRLRLIQLPAAVPVIVAGLRLATVYSMLGVVVAELVASEQGLGQLLIIATNSYNIAGAFGILVILGFLAMSLNSVVSFIEGRFSWRAE